MSETEGKSPAASRPPTLTSKHSQADRRGTWHYHVMDMTMLRAGALSPARAIQLWNKYWHQGVAQLRHYRTQLQQTDNQHC